MQRSRCNPIPAIRQYQTIYARIFLPLSLLLISIPAMVVFTPGIARAQQQVTVTGNPETPIKILQQTDTTAISRMLRHADSIRYFYPDSSIQLLKIAFRESNLANFDEGSIHALYSIANIYIYKGDFERAMELCQLGLSYCARSEKNMVNATGLFNNIGVIYREQGKYESAMQYFIKAIQAASERPAKISPTSLLNNVGYLLINVKQYEKALDYLNQAEAEARKKNTEHILATILVNKGLLYDNTGDDQKALTCYQEALSLARQTSFFQIQLTALCRMGDYYQKRNMPAEALPYLQQALLLKKAANPWYYGTVLIALGKCYIKLKDYKNALTYLEEARKIAKQYNLQEHTEQAHKHLASVYAQKGDYRKAFHHQYTYADLKDTLTGATTLKNISQMEIRYQTAEKDKQLVQNQLLMVQQENRLKEKNIWIGGIGAGATLLGILLFTLYKNNQQRQKLQAEKIRNLQQQQELIQFKSIIQGEEKERTRIARELHDGIVGKISAVKLNFTAMQNRRPELIVFDDFQDAMQQLDETIVEVRETAHNLIPEILLHTGLDGAIQNYCQKIGKNLPFALDFEVFGTIPRFHSDFELAVYRITQELIQNIIKHARPTAALIQVNCQNDLFSITAEDNGKGFNKDSVGSGGIGLQNLRTRVKAFNGYMDINSDQQGTTVYIEFDIHNQIAAGQKISVCT